jgi:hypothetical protein
MSVQFLPDLLGKLFQKADACALMQAKHDAVLSHLLSLTELVRLTIQHFEASMVRFNTNQLHECVLCSCPALSGRVLCACALTAFVRVYVL